MPLSEVFLDTSYAIALASRSDQYHAHAEALAERLERERSGWSLHELFFWRSEAPLPGSDSGVQQWHYWIPWNMTPMWKLFPCQSRSMQERSSFIVIGQTRSGD